MKCVFIFLLLFTVKNSVANDRTGMAELIQTKVENFKAAMDSAHAGDMADSFIYTVNLGSGRMDTTDFCFRISIITGRVELDQTFRNYYFMMKGRPVLLYLNHQSMQHLVAELHAKKIDTINLEEIRSVLMDGSIHFEHGAPYQVCFKKYGTVSGNIIFPHYEGAFTKPKGILLKYLPSLPR